jgi:hypothetical protein
MAIPSGAQPYQITFKLGESGQYVEEHFPHRVYRIIDAGSQCQFYASACRASAI